MIYKAPLDDIGFVLSHVVGIEAMAAQGLFGDLDAEVIDAVLSQAGRFVEREVAPLNHRSDQVGAGFSNGAVTTPPGWKELYAHWVEAMSGAMTAPPEFGGPGLPSLVETAAMEMVTSGCMSFSMGLVVSQGAADTLLAHADEALRRVFVPRLVSGEWMGTMDMTEPHAGSDLTFLKTRAVPQGDGSYRLFGQKIFISYGEHDLAENIIHLVLARLPDAPAGTKGLSLFLVPKILVNDDGSLGGRNDVACVGIEHKMGIRASPTCSMAYGDGPGARGWIIGRENGGLACMFTMMNKARLATGLQGVSIGERAYQQALAYAMERRQGRARGAGFGMARIIEHPDVARMLMTMRSQVMAARAICYAAAQAIDLAHAGPDDAARERGEARAGLLTPVAKAFCTEIGVEVASLGIQVHGGIGFVEETGAAQHLRDIRIAPIYEGTNGMQAIDLVNRKIRRDGGRAAQEAIGEFKAAARRFSDLNRDGTAAGTLDQALDSLERATLWLLDKGRGEGEILAGASAYLRLFGLVAGAAYLARGLCSVLDGGGQGGGDIPLVVDFYCEQALPECPALLGKITGGHGSVLRAVDHFATLA